MSETSVAFVSLPVTEETKDRFIKHFKRFSHGVTEILIINVPENLFVLLIIPKDRKTSDILDSSFKEGHLKRNGWHKYFAKQELIRVGLS